MCRFKEIEFLLKENIFIADYFRFIFIVGGSQAGVEFGQSWLKFQTSAGLACNWITHKKKK